jgi:hypothetical protein
VYFRVTEEEFLQLKQLCDTEGARSISDLARDAVGRMILQNGSGGEVRERLREINRVLDELNQSLRIVNQMMTSNATSPSHPDSSRPVMIETGDK